jgi:hypothetical protein
MGKGGSPAGECAPAAWHRLRGTGLGLHASVTASSALWRLRGPRTAGFSGASACARGPGTARLTWRCAGDVVCGSAGCTDPIHLLLPSQKECHSRNFRTDY